MAWEYATIEVDRAGNSTSAWIYGPGGFARSTKVPQSTQAQVMTTLSQDFGRDGWELVSVTATGDNSSSSSYLYRLSGFFKRQVAG
jgi:hypothetical protein